MEGLPEFIRRKAAEGCITLADAQAAAVFFNLPLSEVEEQALLLDIMPMRFIRNCLSCAQQLRLLRSKVTVVGCGGLGGSVADILVRTGIGSLRLVDPDCFEEHNLNRQRFATIATLGQAKVEAARTALTAINPAIRVEAVQAEFSATDIIAAEVVVDALDSAGDRLLLAGLCKNHGRPLVHGAVRAWYGQVGIATRQNDLIAGLYPQIEPRTAHPPRVIAPTVTLIACLQAAETCKLLLGLPSALTAGWLSCNLLDCEYELIPGSPSTP